MSNRPGFSLTGTLADGKLTFDAPERYRALARKLSRTVKRVTVTIEKEIKRRSTKQNAWLWSCAYVFMLADSGYEENELDAAKEDLHYSLVEKCFGKRYDEKLKAEVPNVRSSNLSTEQFSYYMEWLQRHAAQEWGVVIPDPDKEWMFNEGEKPKRRTAA